MVRDRHTLQRKIGFAALAAAALLLSGCVATQDWVQEYVAQQNAPIKAEIARVDGRVTQTDGRVAQVAQQTAEARRVADQGVQKADGVNSRVSKALTERHQRTMVESASLRYGSGKYALTPEQKQVLDGVYEKLAKNPTYTADIVGQADREGARKDNYLLSLRRTEHVRRYLAEKGEVLHRLSFIGFGEDVADAPARQAEHRDVTINLYKPTIE